MDFQTFRRTVKDKYIDAERFVRFVIHHFLADDCTYRASALAFTSLLAVVPLMTVGFSILSSFPVFRDLSIPIQDFIFENFVPATGKLIQGYLQQFAAQAYKLSLIGVIFLFVTAILVMVTIEQAMNKIWRVASSRYGVSAFLLYWAILSFAPVLLGLSVAASSYLISLPILKDQTPSFLLSYLPFFLSLFAFTFLYVVVPNCPVKIRHGFGGALVAAILFESAKLAFGYYLTRSGSYELLYGAFAAIPIFFIWVYWVWIITLLGAEISYALSVHYQRRTGSALDGFSHALLWLNHLWEAQKIGKGVTLTELINDSAQPFAIDVDDMMESLCRHNLVHITEEGHYMLSRNLEQVTLYDIRQILPYRLPTVEELEKVNVDAAELWKPVLKKNDEQLHESLSLNLAQLFSKRRLKP